VHGRDYDESRLTGGVHTSRDCLGTRHPIIERQFCTWGMIRSMQPRQRIQRALVPDGQSEQQQDWLYLAQLIKERRLELGLTQAEVHSAGGPAPATLYLLENGCRTSFSPQILRRLERALGWSTGSIRRVLVGGRPALIGEDTSIPSIHETRADVPNSQAWMASFRQLPISPHEKLLILSRLLEETIAGLNANLIDESASPDQVS
jgi:DNA-binding XRE family transcriptional regulator